MRGGGAVHTTASLLLLSVQTDRNLSSNTKHNEADIRSQICRRIIDFRCTQLDFQIAAKFLWPLAEIIAGAGRGGLITNTRHTKTHCCPERNKFQYVHVTPYNGNTIVLLGGFFFCNDSQNKQLWDNSYIKAIKNRKMLSLFSNDTCQTRTG